jgi:hypothetical protein
MMPLTGSHVTDVLDYPNSLWYQLRVQILLIVLHTYGYSKYYYYYRTGTVLRFKRIGMIIKI